MWEGFGSADTWEPLCDVILPKGTVNPILDSVCTPPPPAETVCYSLHFLKLNSN